MFSGLYPSLFPILIKGAAQPVDDVSSHWTYSSLLWIWIHLRPSEHKWTWAEKNPIHTIKYGGGFLILWGYFASTGPGVIVKVNDIMNFTQYHNILVKNWRRLKVSRKWIFQINNNPNHTLKSTKKWLIGHKVRYLQWQSQSPEDLKPIKNL